MTQRNTIYKKLTAKEEWLGGQMVDISISIHKALGPGLLESIYEKCFCYELRKRNIPFVEQQDLLLIYDKLFIESGLCIDILVEDLLIIELKAQENYHPVWEAQLLSYLKLSGRRLGFIFN